MNNISKLEQKDCCGCSACFNICPVEAISMKENAEGFLSPSIDENKCTNCGLCAKVCPCLNPKYENKKNPDCYAFMASDEVRTESTSGGAFYVLAQEFIKNGDYVAGAVWTEDFGVEHIVSDKLEDIEKMRKSKYLQSNINKCYSRIKEILKNDKKVLFTGTPCQIAGLKAFLQKDYEKLFCVDIICHGVPSPKVFRKYIEEEKLSENGEKWINTNFRNKIHGWNTRLITTTTTTTKTTQDYAQNDSYMQAFLKNICLRQSCGNCRFNKLPRQSDMTIGDFWGIKSKYNDELGTSELLVNNSKGKYLLGIISKSAKLLVKQSLKKAIKRNPNIVSSTKIHKDRNKFFEILDKILLKDAKNMFIDDNCDCMILNFWSAVNYGAILTCYGLQCLIEELGYYPKVINYIGYPKSVKCKDFKQSFSYKFAEKYLNLTNEVNTYEDFYKLNKYCNTFITGSDQVWRKSCINGVLNGMLNWTIFLLDFVRIGKKKISYAPSLGITEIDGTQYDYEIMNYYLSQFDSISVREDVGQELLKSNFGMDSTQIIDSVVHIPKEKLIQLTKDYNTDEKYIACFTLPYFKNENWYKSILNAISKKLDLPVKEFKFNYKTPVEEWLGFIKNSQFVVTDSYHGTLTSILFNVPFVQIMNATQVQNRFDTIYRSLEIKNRTVSKFNPNVNYRELLEPLDWETINKNIDEERKRASEWLKNALKEETKCNKIYPNFIQETNLNLRLLVNKSKIIKKYIKAKLLSIIMIGRKKQHYKDIKKTLKEQVRKIRELTK